MDFEQACKEGNLELVKEIYPSIFDIEFTCGFQAACRHKNLSIIKYLSLQKQIKSYYWVYVINDGNVEIAKFFQTIYESTPIYLDTALLNERYEIAKFILSTGVLPNESSIKNAIQTNAIDQINYYYSNGNRVRMREYSDLEIIKYLIDFHAPIPNDILAYILALEDRKDLAKYLVWNYNIPVNLKNFKELTIIYEIMNEVSPILNEFIGQDITKDITSIISGYLLHL